MSRVVLLGASGSLGSKVASLLEENDVFYARVTRDPLELDGIYWDYKGSIPSEIKNAKCIIHCARGPEFLSNVAAVLALLRDASAKTKIILMGSNCVFAHPKSTLARKFFSGDAYILEKQKIERLARKRSNTILLRPTVVRDEGGWDSFLSNVKSAETVKLPRDCKDSRIKIIDSVDVAREILKHVVGSNSESIPDELYSDVLPLSEFLCSTGVVYGLSDNTYFEGFLKNMLVSILCSVFVPFRFKAFLQQQFIKPNQVGDDCTVREYSLDGMARLYLCGGHTEQ